MAKRAKVRKPIGTFSEVPDNTDTHMRTIVQIAILEIPPETIAQIATGRPKVSPQDYDAARKIIAEHLVVRIREMVDCRYGKSGAAGGHG